MAVIWQSSAFWLMICTVLLVLVGCTVLRNRFPESPELLPHDLTITPDFVTTNLPPDTTLFMETATPFDFTSDNIFLRSTSPPPDSYSGVDNPVCYELAGGNFDCLGRIWNLTEAITGDLAVEVSLFDDTGTKLASRMPAAAQRITPPGQFATYRTIIDEENLQELSDNVVIAATLINNFPPSPDIQQLTVTDSSGALTASGVYHLSVTIRNDSGFIAEDIRIFTTLDNEEWGIVGYDVYEVAFSLQNGESQDVELNVIPLALPDHIQHILHVEAMTRP